MCRGSGFESSLPPGITPVPLCRPSQKVEVHLCCRWPQLGAIGTTASRSTNAHCNSELALELRWLWAAAAVAESSISFAKVDSKQRGWIYPARCCGVQASGLAGAVKAAFDGDVRLTIMPGKG
jgi:hypothetical protein